VAGEEALGLCPEDLLLYLTGTSVVHHALVGLLWYYDLYLVLERWAGTIDWAALSVARPAGACAALSTSGCARWKRCSALAPRPR